MQKEITLRDFIEMILKRKIIICAVTVISILISGIYSFIVPIEYTAFSVLLANPIINDEAEKDIDDLIYPMNIYPSMTVNTYKEQLINPTVLANTIEELGLKKSDNNVMHWSELARKISVEIIDKTNMIKVSVVDNNPDMAAKIANSVSENFIEFITDNTRKFAEQATFYIEEQLQKEGQKLEEQSKLLQEYLSGSQNVEQLKMEVSSLYSKINTYNMELINVEKQIVTDTEALNSLKSSLKNNKDINVNNDFSLSLPLTSSNNIELNIDPKDDLKSSLITIKITDLETRLFQELAEKKSLDTTIKELEERLKNIQIILANEEIKYNTIQRNYNLVEQTYNTYLAKHKEALLIVSANAGEATVIVSSPATVPILPTSKGKVFYLALGTAVGLMLGFFSAFVVAYWKETDPRKRGDGNLTK